MPNWLPYAWAICGLVALGGMLLGELIFDEKLTLQNVLFGVIALVLGPIGIIVVFIGALNISTERNIVLYRRKKEPALKADDIRAEMERTFAKKEPPQ